ncbi:helix-turn-helix domain-containing protein [Ekhidna sp.]
MEYKIKTYDTSGFMDKYIDLKLKKEEKVNEGNGTFLIMPVQQMLKASKLPVPPTRATTHTLIFLTEGKASMKIGLHPVHAQQGECMIVPAGQIFSYREYEINDGYIIVFDNHFLIGKIGNTELLKDFEFLNVWGNPTVHPDTQTATYIIQTLNRIYNEYAANGIKNQELLQTYLLAALFELKKVYKPLSLNKSKRAVEISNRFKDLVHTNIRELHKVSDYASIINVTTNHLNKTVKVVTGRPASKWIEEMLIIEAKVLLFQTNDPINAIAAELGILDHSYFSRLFKKLEGVSPRRFRKLIDKS